MVPGIVWVTCASLERNKRDQNSTASRKTGRADHLGAFGLKLLMFNSIPIINPRNTATNLVRRHNYNTSRFFLGDVDTNINKDIQLAAHAATDAHLSNRCQHRGQLPCQLVYRANKTPKTWG